MFDFSMEYPKPRPAPFAVGQKVRYVGPAFTMRTSEGTYSCKPGDIGECVKTARGYRGGTFLGYDEDDSEPMYSQTAHDWSVVRFADGYEPRVDAETDQFELAD
jgi:hypothetical protein